MILETPLWDDPMPPFELKVTLTAEKDTAEISFPTKVELSAPELDSLIGTLAKIRSALEQKAPAEAPIINPDLLIHDPRWQSSPAGQDEGAYLQFQHPGFGWLQFRLPRRELAKLASFLQTVAGVTEAASTIKN